MHFRERQIENLGHIKDESDEKSAAHLRNYAAACNMKGFAAA